MFGIAMGLPISSIIAILGMKEFKNNVIAGLDSVSIKDEYQVTS